MVADVIRIAVSDVGVVEAAAFVAFVPFVPFAPFRRQRYSAVAELNRQKSLRICSGITAETLRICSGIAASRFEVAPKCTEPAPKRSTALFPSRRFSCPAGSFASPVFFLRRRSFRAAGPSVPPALPSRYSSFGAESPLRAICSAVLSSPQAAWMSSPREARMVV